VYQLHAGTYAPRARGAASTFLDVIGKIEYLVALGINVLQPLPVDELETDPSLGYNGADLFSPDLPYQVGGASLLSGYLKTINRLLKQKGFPPIAIDDIANGPAQLKAFVDLCHLYGIAVVFDVVYNHAGGFDGDDRSLFFWDRAKNGDLNQSLYFTDQDRGTGGLSFALWNNDVREFLINNATFYLTELWFSYEIGFPFAGRWVEVFNSDVYDNFVNPIVAGNGGGVSASGGPLHGFPASASVVIPANGVVVFARQ